MTKPVVIVTGASKGIGLAVTSILLHKFESQVVALSRTLTSELQQLRCDDLLSIQCDITNEAAVVSVVKEAERIFHHIDGLVLNAGTLDPLCRIADETPLSSWKTHFDVNFFSLITIIRETLPALRRSTVGGRIVFVSSGAAIKGTPGWGPYNASKAAMNSLCRTLAEEETSVTSVALRPGMVDTNMQLQLREAGGAHMNGSDHQKFVKVHTDGHLLPPEQPGHVIAALSVRAPASLSGEFISWDEERCKTFRSS